MTTQATGHVISVGVNIVKAGPIAPLGAVFVEHEEKKNHFASQCRAREKTHNVEFEEDETSEEESLYYVTSKPEMTGTVNSDSEREIYAQMLINEKPIKFHIDCGATVNVLPSKYVNKEVIQPTKGVLQMWNKTELKPEGICRVTIRNPRNQKKYSVEFIIVKENLTLLLGAAVIQQMGLIEVHKRTSRKSLQRKWQALSPRQHKNSLKNTVMYLRAIWGHLKDCSTLKLTLLCLPPLHHHDECHSPLNRSSKLSLID